MGLMERIAQEKAKKAPPTDLSPWAAQITLAKIQADAGQAPRTATKEFGR